MKEEFQNVIVTGADGGIGSAIVERLIQDGYSPILFDSKNDQQEKFVALAEQAGVPLKFFQFDITNPQLLAEVFQEIASEYPSIYGLINNAGIYPITRLEEYTLELWNQVLTVNLTAAFLCTQFVIPLMKELGGRIINITSTGAHLGSRDPGYSASKAGLIGLTKSSARNLSQYHILVNAVAPGTIDTQMSRRMKKEDKEKNVEQSLVKRLGVPSDVSGAVHFLLSEDSAYISGFTIDVNGGLYIR